MARQFAPLYTDIWNDEKFLALSGNAQRMFMLAFSQQNITWAGVLPFTAKRWSKLAKDTTPKSVAAAFTELAGAGFVVVDEDTEEVWVRSYVKHNSTKQPKLRQAAIRSFSEISSPTICSAAVKAYPWLAGSDGHEDDHTDGQGDAHDDDQTNADPMGLVLGVDVEESSQEQDLLQPETTNTNTELESWLLAEAGRQADAWIAKDPKNIIDRAAWVKKRARTLAGEYDEIPSPSEPRRLRLVCTNPDCREGYDVAGLEPVPCTTCKLRVSA